MLTKREYDGAEERRKEAVDAESGTGRPLSLQEALMTSQKIPNVMMVSGNVYDFQNQAERAIDESDDDDGDSAAARP